MARIIADQEIVHSAIQSYLKQSLEDYSQYMQSAPVFVTYYSKDHFESTFNASLNSVANVFGSDSPIKYNLVENCPLWGITGTSLATDMGQFGQEADVSAEAVMIPGVINPVVDDVFTIFHDGADAFYRVNNVEYSILHGKRFCKLTFHLTTDADVGDLGIQTSKTYTVVADGTSPEHFRVLLKTRAELMMDFITVKDRLQTEYVNRFISNKYELPVLPWKEGFFYDYGLADFIRRHKLLSRERGYRDEKFIQPLELTMVYEDVMYDKTVYRFIEGRVESFTHDFVSPIEIGEANPESHVHLWPDKFYISWDYSASDLTDVKIPAFTGLSACLTDSAAVPPNDEALIVKQFMAKGDEAEIFTTFEKISPSRSNRWFFYGPILIFIAKQIIEKLRTESIN
jgi:hypothetical protein